VKPLLRKNIAYLPEAELQNLREAFRRLPGLGGVRRFRFTSMPNYAEHYNSLIWPWHRAYLLLLRKEAPGGGAGGRPAGDVAVLAL